MATVDEVRESACLAAAIIGNLFDAEAAATRYRRSQSESYARDFIQVLYEIEEDSAKLSTLLQECGGVLSAGNALPVELWPPPSPSAVEAVCRLGQFATGDAAFEVAREGRPDLFGPPGEYFLPRLFREQEMLGHVEAAIRGFYLEWPGNEALNRASAMVNQETARALLGVEKGGPSRTEPALSDPLAARPAYTDADLEADLRQRDAIQLPDRGCAARDYLWNVWRRDGLGVSAIRDRWNAMSCDQRRKAAPESALSAGTGERGRNLVKSALAQVERDLSDGEI
jgi:hypothetical protein